MTKQEILQTMNQEYDKIVTEISVEDLRERLEETRQKFPRTFDYPLPPASGTMGKIKLFVKRVIRKCMRFVLKPYADQMNAYESSLYEFHTALIDSLDKAIKSSANAEDSKDN